MKAEHGSAYSPACAGTYVDALCSDPTTAYVEVAITEQVLFTCSPSHACPANSITEADAVKGMADNNLWTAYKPIAGGSLYTLRDNDNRVVTEFADSLPSRDNIYIGNVAVASYLGKQPGVPGRGGSIRRITLVPSVLPWMRPLADQGFSSSRSTGPTAISSARWSRPSSASGLRRWRETRRIITSTITRGTMTSIWAGLWYRIACRGTLATRRAGIGTPTLETILWRWLIETVFARSRSALAATGLASAQRRILQPSASEALASEMGAGPRRQIQLLPQGFSCNG